MAHHIYHTRGVILGSVAIGEANRFYKIFTEDIGLVSASAQSVREGKSKLRYALKDFSFATIDLVRGREVWRITSASEWHEFPSIKGDSKKMVLFARFCALLARLIQGEGREPELFLDIAHAAEFLEAQEFSNELVPSFEALVAFRVLARLGYIDPEGYEKFLTPGEWTKELLRGFENIRIKILPQINEALRASHL